MGREHWVETTLGDLFVTTSGGTPSRTNKNYYSGSISWVKSGELKDSKILSAEEHITAEAIENSSAKIFPKGTILIALYGANIGKLGVLGVDAATNQAVCAIFTSKFVQDSFLFFYLLSQRENIIKLGFGAAQPNISQQTIRDLPFPLAPLNEQKRIVEKLDTILPKVKNAKARLENIPKILKKFRQSVLSAACSGKLTEEWREIGGFNNDFKLIELNDVVPKGGLFDGPFGSNLKTSDYIESGVRVIRLENIGHNSFLSEKGTFVSKEKYEYLKKHSVGEGDIIFSSFINDEIRCCILPDLKKNAIAKADCFTIRPDENLIDKRFLLFVLLSRETFEKLTDNIHGVSRPRINTTQLKRLEIRMFPIEEQHEIVRRVEKLFALADSLEEKYKIAIARVEKIEQSVLAKAFRGELVEPDPNDEPAEILLKRILDVRAVRAKNLSPLRKPRKRA